jgi:hypothetical protein
LDQDGWLDLFVPATATAETLDRFVGFMEYEPQDTAGMGKIQRDYLFRSNGRGGWSAGTLPHQPPSFAVPGSAAAAVADYVGDGDLDIAEAYMATMLFRLLRNDTPAGHWLTVKLDGRAPNVDGTGAMVSIEADGARLDRRYVVRAHGSVGKSWARAHFGLGDRATVDAIEVRWLSGTVQRVEGPISADRMVVVQEK